jgi:hypothetical protein
VIAAVPVRWLLAASIEQQLYAARMVGVGLYVLTVASAWRIASILAPERLGTSLAPPLIVALAPSFADQMSSLNGDVLVNFASTALLLGCVLLVRHSLRVVPLLLVALGLLVAVAAKRTALIDVVPVALAIYWSIVRRPVRWFIWLGVLVAVLFVAGSTMLQLSPAGVSLRPWLADLDQRYLRLSLGRLLTAPAVPADLRGYRVLFQVVFSSFWFGFGWGQVTVAPFWEWAVLGVTLASAVGLALIASQRWRAPDLWRRRVAWLFVAMLASASLAVVVRFGLEQSSYVPRGRYLHLAMLPAIWLLVLGFQHLAPERRRRQAIGGLVIFFIVLDVVCWAGVLSSFYYR